MTPLLNIKQYRIYLNIIVYRQTTFRIAKSIAPITSQSNSYCTNANNHINQEKSPNKFNIKLKLAVMPKNEDPAVTRSTSPNTNQAIFTNNIDNISYHNSSKLTTIPLASFDMFSKKNRPLHSLTGQGTLQLNINYELISYIRHV